MSKWSGKFTLAYNADSSHQAWVDAVCNGLKNVLGIDAEGKPYPTFSALRKDVTARTITGAFRSGWQADYPGLYDFIQPLYYTKASSNDGDYSNPALDKLIDAGRLGQVARRVQPAAERGADHPVQGPAGHPALVLERERWLQPERVQRRRSAGTRSRCTTRSTRSRT